MFYDLVIPQHLRERVFTNSGCRYKDVLKPIFKDDGSIEFEVTDKQDLYAYIQIHKDSVDINKLLELFAETGDMSIFYQNQQEPMYGDFFNMPKTVAEMYQRVHDVNDAFMALDPEVREKFGNSPEMWLASLGSEEWLKNMGLEGLKSSDGDVKVDEVVENHE